jgi:putative addiction module killer protein
LAGINVEIYADGGGKQPFWKWLKKQSDAHRITVRLRKIEKEGHLGDRCSVGEGVHELRFHFGKGYRVYFAEPRGQVLVLCAGIKDTQASDIETAKRFWQDWKENNE